MNLDFVTTKPAMHFAGLHQIRFNEAYAKGFYPCAPATVAGASRQWQRDDLVALRFYRFSLAAGVLPRLAGAQACELLTFMKKHPEAQVAYRVYVFNGENGELHGPDEVYFEGHRLLVGQPGSGVPVPKWECLDIGLVRADAEWAVNNEEEILFRHRAQPGEEG